MHARQTATLRRVASIAAAVALAAPSVAAGASSNPTLNNDLAHFGTRTARGSSATALNDRAHFRTTQAPSASSAPAPTASSPPVVVRVDGGFDWISATVGAAGALGLVLVIGAGASAFRRRVSGQTVET